MDFLSNTVIKTPSDSRKTAIDEILKKHGVSELDILSARRDAKTLNARNEVILHVYENTMFSYPRIARMFNRVHSTIMHVVKKHNGVRKAKNND